MSARATGNAPISHPASTDRIRGRDPIYWELRDFLDDEAALLDEQRLDEWLDLLADDIVYWMPVRVGTQRGDGDGFALRMGLFDDSKKSLAMRVRRIVGTKTAWTEDPPSRTGRYVTNVRIFGADKPDEFLVESNLLVTRTYGDSGDVKLLSARRRDLLRQTEDGVRVARREIYINHSTLDMQNFAVFF